MTKNNKKAALAAMMCMAMAIPFGANAENALEILYQIILAKNRRIIVETVRTV